MKIGIEDIFPSPTEITFTEDAQELRRTLASGQSLQSLGGAADEYSLEESPVVQLSYFRSEQDVFLSGTVHGRLRGQCGRCLEPYSFSLDRVFSVVLIPQPALGRETELRQELREDELSASFYQGDSIDVSAVVQEQILLTLPSVPLCEEECQGLCAHCGANLNQETCECQLPQLTQPIPLTQLTSKEQDPRLAVLSPLRDSRQGITK